MSAIRVIDDHLELKNIGTKSHAEIEEHIPGIGNYSFPAEDGAPDQILVTDGAGTLSWEDKYTDEKAVAACDASDKFIERNSVNEVTDVTTFKRNSYGKVLGIEAESDDLIAALDVMGTKIKNSYFTYQQLFAAIGFPILNVQGTDKNVQIGGFVFLKPNGYQYSYMILKTADNNGNAVTSLEVYSDKIDLKNHTIKDIKNHDNATLSGTPKILEFDIEGTPYYVKVYPTKS